MKKIIKKMYIYWVIYNLKGFFSRKREYKEWLAKGSPIPPCSFKKHKYLIDQLKKYKLHIFVETGTFHGDTTWEMSRHCKSVYTIELSRHLYEKAAQRFKWNKKVQPLQGDSGEQLKNVMSQLDEPALFWLDGHYSAGETAKGNKVTPIFEELSHILNDSQNKHVIIIDDARLFGKDPEYPSFENLIDFILERKPSAKIIVENDAVRIYFNR